MQTMLYSGRKEIRVRHHDGTAQLVPTSIGPAIYVDSDSVAYVTTAEHSGFIAPRVLYPVGSLKRFVAGWEVCDPVKESVRVADRDYAAPRDLLAAVAKGLGVDLPSPESGPLTSPPPDDSSRN